MDAERLARVDERLARVEQLLPSIQARLKTVERNAPLELRLRKLEQRLDSEVSHLGSRNAVSSVVGAWAGLGHWLSFLWRSTSLLSLRFERVGAGLAEDHGASIPQRAASGGGPPRVPEPGALSTSPPVAECKVAISPANPQSNFPSQASIGKLHREACAQGKDTYKDPATGFDVFTADHLRSRDCCGSGCRHCPWGHRNVPSKRMLTGAIHAPKSTLYTRKGDTGWTNLYNENWILKSELVYDAIGDVDELNSAVGLARATLAEGPESDMAQQLEVLQGWLLDVGSALCTPRNTTQHVRKLKRTQGVTEEVVGELESWIDQGDDQLRLLQNFILPGGSVGSGALHMARTICRRAERHTWPLIIQGHALELLGIFLNRLSDYLFVVARLDAHASGADEQDYGIESKVDRWQRNIHTAAPKQHKEHSDPTVYRPKCESDRDTA